MTGREEQGGESMEDEQGGRRWERRAGKMSREGGAG